MIFAALLASVSTSSTASPNLSVVVVVVGVAGVSCLVGGGGGLCWYGYQYGFVTHCY